jgi:MFS transporter, ACS family, solute carrier family 17 (sodium-dependent inorganic phosphate cotransporter), other
VILLSIQSYAACIPVRYIVSILGSIGMAIIYGLKVNLSVAIVAMVNHTAIKMTSNDLHSLTNVTVSVNPEECSAPNVTSSTSSNETHVN